MTSLRRRLLLKTFVGFDLWLLAASLYFAVLGRGATRPSSIIHLTLHVHTVVGVALLVYAWHLTFNLMGLHQSRRLATQASEFVDVLKTVSIAAMLVAATALMFQLRSITPVATLWFLPISACLLLASRLAMRPLLKAVRRRGHNLRHLLIAGTNSRAIEFAEDVCSRAELGYLLDGFIDSGWYTPSRGLSQKVVCDIAHFRSYLRDHVVDELVIALPIKSFYGEASQLVELCREQGIVVRVFSDLFSVSTGRSRVDQIDSRPIVSFYRTPSEEWPFAAKRLFDIIGSFALLLLFSPVLLLALILVKLDSRGSALFTQDRVGLNKRHFRMYKFRSMVANATELQAELEKLNEAQGPVFKIKDDPRITRIGKILRKTSIDELPQLFNVLKGDMSLVGPRPLPVRDYNGFSQDWHRRRFSVRPGVTCLWQVKGRSGISFDQWMDLDMHYIDYWSFWMDIKILVKTVPAVLKGVGAA